MIDWWHRTLPKVDENDFFLVIGVTRDYQGWLPNEGWYWINARLFPGPFPLVRHGLNSPGADAHGACAPVAPVKVGSLVAREAVALHGRVIRRATLACRL